MGWFNMIVRKRSEGEGRMGATAASEEFLATSKDPVCGKQIQHKGAPAMMNYEGQTLYFCSDSCFRLFRGNPMKYIMGHLR